MNDETPDDAPGDASEAATSDVIQYMGADGEWHDIEVEPKRTGDLELDEIWSMSFEELEQILEDEGHPLHNKAKQVSAEVAKPFIDAANDIMRPLAESIAKADMKALFPALDTSWFAKLAPNLPKFELPESLAEQLARLATLQRPPAIEAPAPRRIDFEAAEPPDASLAEIREAAEASAQDLHKRQVEILSDLLIETRASGESGKEALEVSKQALAATRDSVKEARGSKTAAWVAAGVGAVGLAATIVFGVAQLLS